MTDGRKNPALEALAGRDDLKAYGAGEAAMLFALELVFNVQDSASIAAAALTDHSNDKGCDLVFVDRDAQRIVVAQGTWSTKDKPAAPANKAADLNQGVSWLLAGDVSSMPESLRSAALEVRDALASDDISEFHVWMCHNLPESANVSRELKQATTTADSLLKRHFPASSVERVSSLEIGLDTFSRLYEQTRTPILVADSYELDIQGGYRASGEKWQAFSTHVSGAWLRKMWTDHETALMSPNVRDYLGIVRSERNINNGMKTTAKEAADRFWVYNNGLTALVNRFELDDEAQPKKITIHGIGVINGAQTVGSLGTLTDEEARALGDVQVMARFVACSDSGVLSDIVQYNNTQNKVAASDFRSTDAVQDRLRREFSNMPNVEYRGGRRGGTRDAISRTPSLLADATVAQSLAAFHGNPNLAYNETRRIWEDDATYSTVFHEDTSAAHILFTHSLMKAIEVVKQDLLGVAPDKRTTAQRKHVDYLSRRGSIPLLIHAVASSLESIGGAAIPNPWRARFKSSITPASAAAAWKPIVISALAFSQQLSVAVDAKLKNPANVSRAIDDFLALVDSTVEANAGLYATFIAQVSLT